MCYFKFCPQEDFCPPLSFGFTLTWGRGGTAVYLGVGGVSILYRHIHKPGSSPFFFNLLIIRNTPGGHLRGLREGSDAAGVGFEGV